MTTLVLVSLLAACGPSPAPEWLRAAERDVDAFERVLNVGGWEAVEEHRRARAELEAVAPPSDAPPLRSMLASDSGRCRAVALAAMSAGGTPEVGAVRTALTVSGGRTLLERALLAGVVGDLSPADVAAVARELVAVYSAESSSTVIAAAYPALSRLPTAELIPLILALARTDARELRLFASVLAKEQLPGGIAELRGRLVAAGDAEAAARLDADLADWNRNHRLPP